MKIALACGFAALLVGCLDAVPEDGDDDGDLVDPSADDGGGGPTALVAGANGSSCIASPYNCRFHAGTGQRVMNGASETWSLTPDAVLRDGNGVALGTEPGTTPRTFNYGQLRTIAGTQHAMMTGSHNASAAWYPVSAIRDAAGFLAADDKVVSAHDPKQGKLACYVIRESIDTSISQKKVVRGTTSVDHDDLGDYLPLQRNNGERSVNLVFSVPGFALGGATTDHFLTRRRDGSRTQFQRVTVPTDSGRPSISIPLYVKDPATGKTTKVSGSARFLYGYVASDSGKRFGWIAQDAVEPSATACP